MSWNKAEERGTEFGLRLMLACLRLFGVRFTRLMSEPPILYYFLFSRGARRASRDYLRHLAATPAGRKALGREPNAWTSLQQFRAFGHGMVDRAAFWAGMGGRYSVDFQKRQMLLDMFEKRRGAILLGAHLGSIEVLRALVTDKSTPVNILVYRNNALKFNAALRAIDPSLELRAIHIEMGSIQFILDLQAAVARGELVAILGDRAELGGEKRTGRCEFLGQEADFPLGPLLIAHLVECPVFLMFALKRGPFSYEVCLESFAERILLDRKRREQDLKDWLGRYVQRLEAHCLSAPLQWFNFYDFWRGPKVDATAGDTPRGTAPPKGEHGPG